MSGEKRDVINISQAIDSGPFTAFQIFAIILCSLVAFLDGLDSQSIAVAAPLIADKLSLAKTALGPIFSAALLGAMIGALTFGPLGDRFGRKRCLIVAAIIFGIGTLLTARAGSYNEIAGGAFCLRDRTWRSDAVLHRACLRIRAAAPPRDDRKPDLVGFPLGGTAGGFLNAYILANFGWPVVFLVGGVLPLVVAGALLIWLPESIRFLLAEDRDPEKARAIAQRIVPSVSPTAKIVADEEHIAGVTLKHLFSEGRAVGTLLLWVPFITAFATLAITVLWTPALLRANGMAPSQAAIVLGFHGIGALVGMGSAGRLMEAFGTTATLVPALILGALTTAMIGIAATSLVSMSIVLALIGLFVGMGASGAIALAALNYPTALRSTGVGWAMGLGRGGQVIAPLIISMMLGLGWGTTQIFFATALAPFVAAVFILAFTFHADRTKVVGTLTPSPKIS